MAQNLYKTCVTDPKNDQLYIYDISEQSTSLFLKEAATSNTNNNNNNINNIHIAKSVSEVAQNSDIIITMLPAPQHVSGVYKEIINSFPNTNTNNDNSNGGSVNDSISLKSPEKIFIDSSTIDVQTSIDVSKLLVPLNFRFFDAPVSGGVVGATNGTLTFMIGGVSSSSSSSSESSSSSSNDDDQVYTSSVIPILSSMGKKLVPCGTSGLGLAAKLCNNYLLALTNIATSESFQLAKALGLDLNLYSGIVASATGRSWSSDVNNPVPGILDSAPASNDYKNGFGLPLMKKDLALAIQAAKQSNLPLLLGDDALNVYNTVEQDEYCKTRDMSVIYKYIEDRYVPPSKN